MELLVLLLSVALFVLFLQLNSLKARVRELEAAGAGVFVERAYAPYARYGHYEVLRSR